MKLLTRKKYVNVTTVKAPVPARTGTMHCKRHCK
jgi:hypothetical protein